MCKMLLDQESAMDMTDLLAECLAAQRRLASGIFLKDEEAAKVTLALIDASLSGVKRNEHAVHALDQAHLVAQAGHAKEALARLENVLASISAKRRMTPERTPVVILRWPSV
jgi:NH3-dependent NAD+ synthetase